jgi:hypothetical protein
MITIFLHKYKEWIGWTGAAGFLSIYILNSANVITSTDILYHVMNLLSATLLGIRVCLDKNYSSLTLELFFIVIAIYYICKALFF